MTTRATDDTSHRLTLAQAIVNRRRAQGMTQAQLAEASGLTRPNLATIERGRTSLRVHTLICLAAALDCRAADLDPQLS